MAEQRSIDRPTVFAACDALVKDYPNDRVTSRQVASALGVSHTAVYKLVSAWAEERKRQEQEAIQQTSMSPHFVSALRKEVEAKVSELRQLDEEDLATWMRWLSGWLVAIPNAEMPQNKLEWKIIHILLMRFCPTKIYLKWCANAISID